MNGGRGMGEEDRLEESGSPENSQPATKSARWKCFQTFNLEKKLNGKYRKSERLTEKKCQAWYAEWILPNVNVKTTVWITERILPFDIPNVDPQIPSIRGCDLSSKLKGSLYSYRPDGFTFQHFVCFRRIRVAGVSVVSLNQLTGISWKKFQVSSFNKFSFKWFSCNFSTEHFFGSLTSPGRWWPWWRCSMLGGGAKSRAGEKWCVRDETN